MNDIECKAKYTLQPNTETRFYKPKRNDNVNVSVYKTPYEFSHHIKQDVYILLDKECYFIGCNGNQKKQKGVSTCHAFLVGKRVHIHAKYTLEKITYNPIEARIYSVVSGDLKQGDICMITTDNEVYKVVFS